MPKVKKKNELSINYIPSCKVVFATPFYEIKGYSPYIESVFSSCKLFTLAGIDCTFWHLDGCSYIDHAKNVILNKFLDSDYTDIFLIDSDMAFDLKTIHDLLICKELVVGVAYLQKGIQDYSIKFLDNDESKKIRQVLYIGGGILRIKKNALKILIKKFPNDYYIYNREKFYTFFKTEIINNKYIGEDIYFCNKLTRLGIPIYCLTDANIQHYCCLSYLESNYYNKHKKKVIR